MAIHLKRSLKTWLFRNFKNSHGWKGEDAEQVSRTMLRGAELAREQINVVKSTSAWWRNKRQGRFFSCSCSEPHPGSILFAYPFFFKIANFRGIFKKHRNILKKNIHRITTFHTFTTDQPGLCQGSSPFSGI